ncbi:MAG TPA: SMP-30/gluconolactonase/LRE family protein, partial [Gemmata sp.]|nr:SMP-30/gluconolactonase/LRE family protein [Gemmata sp.]
VRTPLQPNSHHHGFHFQLLIIKSQLLSLAIAFAVLISMSRADEPKAPVAFGSIERKDPKFDALIPKEAKIEVLAGGFLWAEGPVWDKKKGALFFTDIPNNRVMRWSPKDGLTEFLKPSGYTGKAEFKGKEPGANGLAFDAAGNLILCQHGDRRISRLAPDAKSFITLADKYMGKRFNSPNDLVYRKSGDLYFTDPPYGLPEQMKDPAKELDFQGVFRLSPKGDVTLLTKEMSRPNGIAFSPDEKILYVSNSDPDKAVWMSFPVNADGTLGPGKVFFDSTEAVKAKKPGLPDGMKVDQKGNIFATGPGGVLVFAPDGTHLGTIATGVPTANCAFGDDGSTLYIAADKQLLRVKTSTRGLGF